METRKTYDPEELVTIPLTRDQWHKILTAVQNDASQHYCTMVQWLTNCADKAFGAETAARYERAYKEMDALATYIDKILTEPWTPKPSTADNEEDSTK